MTANTTVQFRIDAKTKNKMRKTLEHVGLDMSTAFNVFAKKVIEEKGIPFDVRTENGYTPAEEKRILKETQYALKNPRGFRSARELHEHILAKK